MSAPDLKFQGLSAKRIKGNGVYSAGVFKYTLAADALGGQLEVTGQYPPEKHPAPKLTDKSQTGTVNLGAIKFKRVQMARLWELLGVKTELGAMRGEISGEFPLHFDKDGNLIGTGSVRAERLRWKGRPMAGIGQAVIRLTPKSFTVDDATLYVGEGMVRIHASYNRKNPDWMPPTLR